VPPNPFPFVPVIPKLAHQPQDSGQSSQERPEVSKLQRSISGSSPDILTGTRETLFTVPPSKRERFINTLVNYSLDDIFNAIENYKITKETPEIWDIGGRIYGNLFGFLENGVNQFFDDKIVRVNFLREKKNGG
jgi:hypothetical protein